MGVSVMLAEEYVQHKCVNVSGHLIGHLIQNENIKK